MSDQALDNFKTLLANCATFQTITGAANATAAKAFIKPLGLPTAPNPPIAFIASTRTNWERHAAGVTSDSGEIEILLELAIPSGCATLDLEYAAVWATIRAIQSEALAKSDESGYIRIKTFEWESPVHSAKSAKVYFWQAKGKVQWPA